MKINLTPQRRDARLELSRQGDVLTINGVDYDFSALAEGDSRAQEEVACDWLAGAVIRQEGVLHLSLILPHGADAPDETLFPAPIELLADGPVTLPPYERDDPVTG